MTIVDRAKSLVLSPRSTWAAIAAEPATAAGLYLGYLVWLAAIPAVCGFIGMTLIGVGGFGITVRVPFLMGLANMVVSYVLSLAGIHVLSLIVNALAPYFGGRPDALAALKLTVYGSTAALVGGVFSLLPPLSILGLLAALYSVYLIYTGLPVLMKNPPEKSLVYTAAVLVCGIAMGLVIGWIGSMFALHPSVAAAEGGAAVAVATPQGKVSIDTAKRDAASRKMGAARHQMEQAQKEGNSTETETIPKNGLVANVEG